MNIIKILKEQGYEVELDGSIPIVYLEEVQYNDEEYLNHIRKIFDESDYNKSYGFRKKQDVSKNTSEDKEGYEGY